MHRSGAPRTFDPVRAGYGLPLVPWLLAMLALLAVEVVVLVLALLPLDLFGPIGLLHAAAMAFGGLVVFPAGAVRARTILAAWLALRKRTATVQGQVVAPVLVRTRLQGRDTYYVIVTFRYVVAGAVFESAFRVSPRVTTTMAALHGTRRTYAPGTPLTVAYEPSSPSNAAPPSSEGERLATAIGALILAFGLGGGLVAVAVRTVAARVLDV